MALSFIQDTPVLGSSYKRASLSFGAVSPGLRSGSTTLIRGSLSIPLLEVSMDSHDSFQSHHSRSVLTLPTSTSGLSASFSALVVSNRSTHSFITAGVNSAATTGCPLFLRS